LVVPWWQKITAAFQAQSLSFVREQIGHGLRGPDRWYWINAPAAKGL